MWLMGQLAISVGGNAGSSEPGVSPPTSKWMAGPTGPAPARYGVGNVLNSGFKSRHSRIHLDRHIPSISPPWEARKFSHGVSPSSLLI